MRAVIGVVCPASTVWQGRKIGDFVGMSFISWMLLYIGKDGRCHLAATTRLVANPQK